MRRHSLSLSICTKPVKRRHSGPADKEFAITPKPIRKRDPAERKVSACADHCCQCFLQPQNNSQHNSPIFKWNSLLARLLDGTSFPYRAENLNMLRICLFFAFLIAFADVNAVAIWSGGAGAPTDIWSEPTNWSTGQPPASATVRGTNDDNVARMPFVGTTTLIDASVNAVAFGVHLGHPIAEIQQLDLQVIRST